MVWADPVSLAATQGIAFCFLFLRVLRCFSSPGLPSHILCIQIWIPLHYEWWVSHSEISGSKLAYSSRSISVFVPSFIGS
ncbi:hypothetical protein CU084_02410 [Bacillus velezensis]|nr:hypothetical protein CU084_02410 [Bacillus velezensis]